MLFQIPEAVVILKVLQSGFNLQQLAQRDNFNASLLTVAEYPFEHLWRMGLAVVKKGNGAGVNSGNDPVVKPLLIVDGSIEGAKVPSDHMMGHIFQGSGNARICHSKWRAEQ